MGRKAILVSGTHQRPARDGSKAREVISAGDTFEPTEAEAKQNADRLRWLGAEPAKPKATKDEGQGAKDAKPKATKGSKSKE